MTVTIAEFFRNILGNDYLTLFVISIIPIIELRGAIVIMGGMQGINLLAGMFCCVAGSTVVILPILFLIRPLIMKLKLSKRLASFGRKMEENISYRASTVRTGQKVDDILHDEDIKKKHLSADAKKFLGLFVFVAVPLPMTGAWTGSAVGSFLDIKIWKATLAIFLGNIAAGGILTLCIKFIPSDYIDVFLYSFVALALAIFVSLYFARVKRREKKAEREIAIYGDRNRYELAKLEREAKESGRKLEKKAFVDDNGDEHIIIGNNEEINKKYLDKNDLI